MSAVDLLFDALSDYRADVAMAGKRVPPCSIEYDTRSGSHAFAVRVAGRNVALESGGSIESAARKTLVEFRRWAEDQSAHIEHALEVSIAEARR